MFFFQNLKETSQLIIVTFQVFFFDIFTVILDFVYFGKFFFIGQNVIEVMLVVSFFQMIDVISVCKIFIKFLLDISEKEKDRYFSFFDKDVNFNGIERFFFYSGGW